jgi:hypothetical protein
MKPRGEPGKSYLISTIHLSRTQIKAKSHKRNEI